MSAKNNAKIKITIKPHTISRLYEIDQELNNHSKSDIFTPDDISSQMAQKLRSQGSLLDPACGTGNLLKFADLSRHDPIDLYDIKDDYLKSCPCGHNIRKICGDFLLEKSDRKYDNIIMNPPYIRCQNLSPQYKTQLKE